MFWGYVIYFIYLFSKVFDVLYHLTSKVVFFKLIAMKQEKGSYLKFLNLLINDSIFLLNESLMKIPDLEEMEVQLGEEQLKKDMRENGITINKNMYNIVSLAFEPTYYSLVWSAFLLSSLTYLFVFFCVAKTQTGWVNSGGTLLHDGK